MTPHEPTRLAHSSKDAHPDPYKWPVFGWLALCFATLPTIVAVILLLQPPPPAPPAPPWAAEAAALGVQPVVIGSGARVYRQSCAVCHGPEGDGIHALGKPLRNSAYVQETSDADLFELIVDGRKLDDPLNTTGALMPPRGARQLTDDEVRNVIAFLHVMQDPDVEPVSTEPWNLKSRDGGVVAGMAIELTQHPGYERFIASCSACHGQGAQGIENQGLPLTTSGYVRSQNDKDLIRFIKSGRPIWDPNNTTGLDMPPKGGNPAITDEDLQLIVDYLRDVQRDAMGS